MSKIIDQYSIELIDPLDNKRDWDDFVESCENSWLYHTSSWLDVLTRVWRNLQTRYVVVSDKKDDAIKASLPLCLIKGSFNKRCLISPPLSTLIEPICNDDSALDYLLNMLPALLAENKIASVEFTTFEKTRSVPDNLFERHDHHCIHTIDLTRSTEELMKSFNRSNVRNRIKKALKSPLSLQYAETEEQLQEFYKLYAVTRKKVGLPSIPIRYFEAIWSTFKKRNQVDLLLAYHDKYAVAGALCLKFGNRTSIEALGYDTDFIGMCPNHLLFWSIINNEKKEGKVFLDFGRTPLNNHGLMTFKNRWGTEKTILPSFSHPNLKSRNNQEVNAKNNFLKAYVRKSSFPLYLSLSDLFYTKVRYRFLNSNS